MGRGRLCGGDDLLVGCVQPSVADVLHDRAGEQVGVLEHHGDVLAQGIAPDAAYVHAVDGDAAGFDVVEAVQQVRDGGLARAGGADEGDLLARARVERDVLQNGLFRHVAEAHIIQHHVTLDHRIHGVLRIGFLGILVHDLEHALRARQGGEHGAHLLGQLVDGARELAGVVDEDGQTAHVKPAQHAQHAADARRQGVADLGDVAHHRAHDAAEEQGLRLLFAQVVVQAAELLLAHALVVEHLHDLLSGHGLLDVAVDRAQRRLLGGVEPATALHDEHAALEEQRQEHHGDQRQPDVGVDHHHQRAQQRGCAGDHRNHRVVQHGADVVHVVGEAAHDFAVVVGVEVAHGQLLQLLKQVVADALHGALGHAHHQPVLQKGRQHRHQVGAQQHDQHRQKGADTLRRRYAHVGDLIEDRAQQIAAHHGRRGAQQQAQGNHDQPRPEFSDVGEDAADGLARVLGLAHRGGCARAMMPLGHRPALLRLRCSAAVVALLQSFKRASRHQTPSLPSTGAAASAITDSWPDSWDS